MKTINTRTQTDRQLSIRTRIQDLGPWFHNLNLNGVQTAPDHFLGDYPNIKWRHLRKVIPEDLSGKSVLDIGCNAGFYSIELKKRGARRVLGIDFDPAYLAQARFAAEVSQVDVEFDEMSVYDVAKLGEKFDIVLFMGVMYHLRYPLLALDTLAEHVVKGSFIFQSLTRGSQEVNGFDEDYPFSEEGIFTEPSYPAMYFVEKSYAHDPTNWWIPNRACAQAMLRSAGFSIICSPDLDVFVCKLATDKDARSGLKGYN
ncbi:MAG TPA: TIGR04290 family methyltransferase [Bryobacteraceae bacterium]|nr:TIGR04290 family methyltransferase [Bryobacteraceae bacterium]HXR78437.1 TIGR04290 family methyltransferase [Bryobacteraceae bacterium]